ncbi:MAG: glycoside hydrolase family 172 protein [Gemmatales bacterium]
MLLLILTLLCQPPAKSIDWLSLLQETSDLSTLLETPAIPFTTHQVSSYDRASVSPQQPETWFANHDRGHALYEGVVNAETAYYAQPPQRGSKPTGKLPAGTKVGIARHRRNVPGALYVYSYDGEGQAASHQGYIDAAAFTPHPSGPVLADIAGPGCLTRFWSSNPGEAGRVKIYLDDQPGPVIDSKLLELLSGQWQFNDGGKLMKPIPSPWASVKARGYEMLYPLPFQSRCLVVVERPTLQYQISYRRYPEGTAVKSWNVADVVEHEKQLNALGEALTAQQTPSAGEWATKLGGVKPGDTDAVKRAVMEAGSLDPGQERTLDLLEPPGQATNRAIVQIEAQVQAERLTEALRQVVLTINFDGAKSPQVLAPLGDFFGTGPGCNPLSTLPLRVTASGKLTCHWIMPYARNARLTLKNLGGQNVNVQVSLTHVPYRWNERSLHFHTSWQSASFQSRPFQDWHLLQLQGQGHHVGTLLSVFNPLKDWWGEGDSKVWIDGGTFPSHWGTGTDDDFGLGWADKTLFSLPWRAQPRHDGSVQGHEGHTSLFRARLLDRIAFQSALRHELEVRADAPNTNLHYCATSFWYAKPGGNAERQVLTQEVLQRSLGGP